MNDKLMKAYHKLGMSYEICQDLKVAKAVVDLDTRKVSMVEGLTEREHDHVLLHEMVHVIIDRSDQDAGDYINEEIIVEEVCRELLIQAEYLTLEELDNMDRKIALYKVFQKEAKDNRVTVDNIYNLTRGLIL